MLGHTERVSEAHLPLLIAVAASPDERIRLAELVDGRAPLLLVPSLEELRSLLMVPSAEPEEAPVLTVDQDRSVARWLGREVPLTRLERDLLSTLNTEPLQVWTFEALHDAVWRNEKQSSADLQSLVKRLRRKLVQLGSTVTIDAVRGTGFRLTDHRVPTVAGK
jgi:DNA-binding winged helix-turn-helix (wHTH) protein